MKKVEPVSAGIQVRFGNDAIQFSGYPFSAASIASDGRLPYANVRDVDPDAAPPEIRTHCGETLFVSAEQRDELRAIAARQRLTVCRRVDVWGLILEPFVDTVFTSEHQNQTLSALQQLGVSRQDVKRIRQKTERSMLAYNSVLWDWCHLGLYDLLRALPDRLVGEFYSTAMELAERGRTDS